VLKMSKSIEVYEIIKALRELNGEAHVKDIKDKVTSYRGGVSSHYKTKRSFRETIQKIVEDHCPQTKNYRGKPYFIRIDRGRYRLQNL